MSKRITECITNPYTVERTLRRSLIDFELIVEFQVIVKRGLIDPWSYSILNFVDWTKLSPFSAYKKGSLCLPCKVYHRYQGVLVGLIWVVDEARVANHLRHPLDLPVKRKEAVKPRSNHRPGHHLLLDSLPHWIHNWLYWGEKWWLLKIFWHPFSLFFCSYLFVI